MRGDACVGEADVADSRVRDQGSELHTDGSFTFDATHGVFVPK